MITKQQVAFLNAAHQRVVDAEVADSWSGAGDPAGVVECELELIKAKMEWEKFMEGVSS